MEKVAIFTGDLWKCQDLSKQVNAWLSENSEKIHIIDRKVSESAAVCQGRETIHANTIYIFYADKN